MLNTENTEHSASQAVRGSRSHRHLGLLNPWNGHLVLEEDLLPEGSDNNRHRTVLRGNLPYLF